MGRPEPELLPWNGVGSLLGPVAEDDREAKTSHNAVAPTRRPPVSMPAKRHCVPCDAGSLSDVSGADIVAIELVTSLSSRLGKSAPIVTCAAPIATRKTGNNHRNPNVSEGLRRRAPTRSTLGTRRSYSLGSGLSSLRARRPVPSGAANRSPYQPLMPLVLLTLGRLRSRGWPCVSEEQHLDAWFVAHSHGDAVRGPPDARSRDVASLALWLTPPITNLAEVVKMPFKPGSVGLNPSGRFRCPDEMFDELKAAPGSETQHTLPSSMEARVNAAVRRARSFSLEQVRAFSNATCARSWLAVDALSGDQALRVRVPRPGSMSVNTKAEIDPTPPDALDFSKATKQSPSFGSFPTDHAHVRDEVNTPCAPESEPFVYATPMEAACKMLFGERGAAEMLQQTQAAGARGHHHHLDTEVTGVGKRVVGGENFDTPTEFRSREVSRADLRCDAGAVRRAIVGAPPFRGMISNQSWDWKQGDLGGGGGSDDGSPRSEERFKRVYSLCNLEAGSGLSLGNSPNTSRASSLCTSRGNSVHRGALFAGRQGTGLRQVDELSQDERPSASQVETTEVLDGALITPQTTSGGNPKRARLGGVKPEPGGMVTKTTRFEHFEQSAGTLSNADIARARDRAAEAAAEATRGKESLRESLENETAPARTRDASEPVVADPNRVTAPRQMTRSNSRESEDSDLMQSLRREWARMRGGNDSRPARGTGGGTCSQSPTTGRSPGEREGGQKAAIAKNRSPGAKQTCPSIQQRLAEVLTPSLSQTSQRWRFNSRVTGLNLSNASIGTEGAAFLAAALAPRRNTDGTYSHNSFLKSLNLEFNNLGCDGAAAIARALAPVWVIVGGGGGGGREDSDQMLTDGDSTAVTPPQVTVTAAGKWVANTSLERLNLNFCEVGPVGAAAIANAIAPRLSHPETQTSSVSLQPRWQHHSGITHLSLFHNRLGANGARALAEALAPRQQPFVDGEANTHDDDTQDEFAFNPTLRSLNVGRNQLGDVGLARIAAAFAPERTRNGRWVYNATFKHLHANANSCLSQEGPLALSVALSPRQNLDGAWGFLATLSTIHLANVLLGEEGGKALGDVFRPRRSGTGVTGELKWTFPSNLRVLNLSKTGLGDGGAKHIADALRPRRDPETGRWAHNPRLKELHLGGASIGPEGAKAIADAIKPRRDGSAGIPGFDDDDALEDFAITDCAYSNEHARSVPQWRFNTSLQVLDLRDNVLCAEGVSCIADAVAPRLDDDPVGTDDADDAACFAMDGSSPVPFATPTSNHPNVNKQSATSSPISPKNWVYGGALAVLNLEFNDAGSAGIAALAAALAPRWCVGSKTTKDRFGAAAACATAGDSTRGGGNFMCNFGRNGMIGGGGGNSNLTSLPGSPRNSSARNSRPSSARVGRGVLATSSPNFANSPNASQENSPANTPRGALSGLGNLRFGNAGDVSMPHTPSPSAASARVSAQHERDGGRPTSARSPSPLAASGGAFAAKSFANEGSGSPRHLPFASSSDFGDGLGTSPSGVCGVGGGFVGSGLDSHDEDEARREPTAHWSANETLRALGIGGNRAGDEGAAALANAIAPVINPDGTWTSLRLTRLDASENDIGEHGLLALARAIDPRCSNPRCACGGGISVGGRSLVKVSTPAGNSPASTVGSRPSSARGLRGFVGGELKKDKADCMRSFILSQNAKDAALAAGAATRAATAFDTTSAMTTGFASLSPSGGDFPLPTRGLVTDRRLGETKCPHDDTDQMQRTWSFDTAYATGSAGSSHRGSPDESPVENVPCAFDVFTGLRKLDLARNNGSGEKIRHALVELKEKLRTGAPGCDVSI